MQLSISKAGIKINENVMIINKNNNFSQYNKLLIMGNKHFFEDIKTLIKNSANNKIKEYGKVIIKKFNLYITIYIKKSSTM